MLGRRASRHSVWFRACRRAREMRPHRPSRFGIERPAVAEYHGSSSAPILVINFRAVLRGDRTHCVLLKMLFDGHSALSGAFTLCPNTHKSTFAMQANLVQRNQLGAYLIDYILFRFPISVLGCWLNPSLQFILNVLFKLIISKHPGFIG